MEKNEVTCVTKVYTNEKADTFEYRDMYNDSKTIDFPIAWQMSVEDVEKYLNNNPEP